MACLMYVVSLCEDTVKSVLWSELNDYYERNLFEIYFYFLHVIHVTITGYGGIMPGSFLQLFYSSFVAMVGIIINISIIGIVSSVIRDFLNKGSLKRQNFEKIKLYIQYKGINEKLKKRVLSYYDFMFENNREWNEEEIFSKLPKYLKTELSIQINYQIITKVDLFKVASKQFISRVVLQLKPRFVLPNQRIIVKGDVGREMYFLTNGKVKVVDEEKNKTLAVLNEGTFFGEIALLRQTVRNATVMSVTFCDLYVLTKESFENLEKEYPREVGIIREEADKRAKIKKKKKEKVEIKKGDGSKKLRKGIMKLLSTAQHLRKDLTYPLNKIVASVKSHNKQDLDAPEKLADKKFSKKVVESIEVNLPQVHSSIESATKFVRGPDIEKMEHKGNFTFERGSSLLGSKKKEKKRKYPKKIKKIKEMYNPNEFRKLSMKYLRSKKESKKKIVEKTSPKKLELPPLRKRKSIDPTCNILCDKNNISSMQIEKLEEIDNLDDKFVKEKLLFNMKNRKIVLSPNVPKNKSPKIVLSPIVRTPPEVSVITGKDKRKLLRRGTVCILPKKLLQKRKNKKKPPAPANNNTGVIKVKKKNILKLMKKRNSF